jgi:hypothetical protein
MRPNTGSCWWWHLASSLAVLTIAGASVAEIYRWTDENGGEHFAMDPSQVPARYRQQAIEGASSRREIQVMGSEANRAGRARSERKRTPTPGPAHPGIHGSGRTPSDPADTPGGHDKGWWQRQHDKVLAEVKRTEKMLERANGLNHSYNAKYDLHSRDANGRSSVKQGDYKDTIRFSEEAVRDARQAHSDFHMVARRAGVLPAWIRD